MTIKHRLRGIRTKIPQGYTLCRVDQGVGPVQLVKTKSLVAKLLKSQVIPYIPVGANPTATASDVAVNGSATTFMRSDAAPAVQKTSSSVFGLCKVDGTTITAVGGVISAVATGSNQYSWPSGVTSSNYDAGAFACKGNMIIPKVNFNVDRVYASLNAVSGQTYYAIIGTLDSSKHITGVAASALITISSTAAQTPEFVFSSPFTMVAGTLYAVAIVRTDSTTTAVNPIGAGSSATACLAFMGTPMDLALQNTSFGASCERGSWATNVNNPSGVAAGATSGAAFAIGTRFQT